MPYTVPSLLQANQPVSDPQLVDAVEYDYRTMQYYIKRPKSPLVNPTKQYRLLEEGYLVLDAAEGRRLQRIMLRPNALGRLRTLLERLEQQMLSRGAIGASSVMRKQTHNLYH